MASSGRGLHLSPGDPILLEVALQLTTENELMGLATLLLEKVGQGGRAFVQNLPDQSIKLKVHSVLEEWVKKKPEDAFGEMLLRFLSNQMVKPSAAAAFKERLKAKHDSSALGMAARRQGVCIKPGDPVLYEMSGHFSTREELMGLATLLLVNVEQGGHAFVQNLPDQSIQLKAHAVLEEWVKKKPKDAFGEVLLEFLSNPMVKPSAAVVFKEQLQARTDSSEHQPPAQSTQAAALPDERWHNISLHEEPMLINMLCESRWNFGEHWREIFCRLTIPGREKGLAFPSPEGEIAEIEHRMRSQGWKLSECFRAVLDKWKNSYTPTAADLYNVFNSLGLGSKAKRCLDEYSGVQ